jgi:hypothetical protein
MSAVSGADHPLVLVFDRIGEVELSRSEGLPGTAKSNRGDNECDFRLDCRSPPPGDCSAINRQSAIIRMVFRQLKNDPHLRLITWGVLLGMGVLFAGLWWVQIISYRHFSENQKAQSYRSVRIPAIRGKILDRNGIAVAENKPSYNVILYLDDLREEFKKEWSRTRPPRGMVLSLPQRRALEAQARYRVASNIVQHIATILQRPVPFSFRIS